MAGINNIGNLSQVNAPEIEQEEGSVGKEEAPQQTDSVSHGEESSEQTPQNLSNAVTGIGGGAVQGGLPLPTELVREITGLAGHDDPETRKAMRSVNRQMRNAVNANVKTVTLKGPDGAALSQARSAFRVAKDLRLGGEQFTNDQARKLAAFATVRSVTLDNTKNVTGQTLAKLPPNTETLRMAVTGQVKDEDLQKLPPNLKNFVAIGVPGITDTGIGKIPKGVKSLGLLSDNFSDAGIKDSPKNLQKFFAVSKNVTDGGVPGLPKNLKELGIFSNNVTGKAIKDIPDSVHTLSLPNSAGSMDEGFEHLAQKKNVHTLTVSSEGVGEATIAKIPGSLKKLHLVAGRSEDPQRLEQLTQQIRAAHPKLTVTSETMADYNKKMGAGLKRGEGDLAFT